MLLKWLTVFTYIQFFGNTFAGWRSLPGSLLCFEIGVTRLFATIYYPPTVFAVLSLGLLGIGLGAALAAWAPQWWTAERLPNLR